MTLTLEILNKVAGDKNSQEARCLLVEDVNHNIAAFELGQPHRVLMFVPQVMHEAGNGRWLEEIWGPTSAQKRYEGRADLGNTVAGDGYKYRGRGWIQCTGRANYREFTKWGQKLFDAPDFEAYPDKLSDPVWAAFSAFWYWSQRVPTRHMDSGDIRAVTKSINGGYNGLDDRLEKYTRCGLAMLGFDTVAEFQRTRHNLTVDGVSGPFTRSEIFNAVKEGGI